MCLSEVSISKDFLISNPWNLSASTRLGASKAGAQTLSSSPWRPDKAVPWRCQRPAVRLRESRRQNSYVRHRLAWKWATPNIEWLIITFSIFVLVKSSTFSDTPRCSSRSPPRRLISRLQKSDTTTLWRRKKAQLQWLRESPVFVSQEPLNS